MKMNKGNYTTVPTASGHIHKHTITFAHRIINLMQSKQTPPHTRRALRHALQRLFNTTDIGRRRSLTKVDNVAAVLGCTGLYYMDSKYRAARHARRALCRVIEAHDWATNPRLKKIAALIAAESRPRARRAMRPRYVPVIHAPVVQRIAA